MDIKPSTSRGMSILNAAAATSRNPRKTRSTCVRNFIGYSILLVVRLPHRQSYSMESIHHHGQIGLWGSGVLLALKLNLAAGDPKQQ